jgi:hypothetical protein
MQDPVDLLGADLTGVDLAGTNPDLAPGTCDVVTQAGCGTSEKCTLSGGGARCVTDGTKLNGQTCGPASDDCIKGTLCTTESSTLRQCRAFCAADTDCKQPAPGGTPAGNTPHCIITLNSSMQKVCTVACNPVPALGASGCASGLACQVFRTQAIAQLSDCTAPGIGTDGADCATNGNADCAAGFGCVTTTDQNNNMQSRCRRICRAGNNPDCQTGGFGCVTPTGATMWGFCIPL